MLLAKSSSLPQIKVNLNKYDNFFTKKSAIKELALDQPEQYVPDNESQGIADKKKKTHVKNLEIIDRKSTIKSKVEAYLTDSRKMGILDHNINETHNRRSLTKISLQAMKPVHTSSEQQKIYLTKLKTDLNQYFEKNQRMEHEIKNSQAMISQVKEKIIFYQQLAQKTWIHRYELLNQREENLQYIRYETDRLKFMQERLKQINILMKKRVKDAQNQLKSSQHQAHTLNQIQGIRQDQLDNKIYLLKHYEDFQFKKSENMGYKTDKAIRNMQQNEAAAILKRHQNSITIMQESDYQLQKRMTDQNKLAKDLIVHKFYHKALESTWTRYSAYYQQYEKAEQLMKMHALDRKLLVQESYKKSFQVKEDLQQKISQKEKTVLVLEEKNQRLKKQFNLCNFGEIEEIQKKVSAIKLQYKTGKKLLKDNQLTEKQKYAKSIIHREDEIDRSKNLLVRLRQWIKQQQKRFQLNISKKQPIQNHYNLLIKTLLMELKQKQESFVLKPAEPIKKTVPKLNKYGNSKKSK